MKLPDISKYAAVLVKAVAEGDPNAPLTRAYRKLKGKKTWISIAIFALWATLELVAIPVFTYCGATCGATPEGLAEFGRYADWLVDLSALLLSIGLFDAAVRLEPPKEQ